MPQDPVAVIEQVIDTCMDNLLDKHARGAYRSADRLDSIDVTLDPRQNPDKDLNFVVTAREPDVPEPTDTIHDYRSELDRLIRDLADKLADFLNKYFPLITNDAYPHAVAWLIDEITNGGHGINEAVARRLWDQTRDRLLLQVEQTRAQITTGYAARGYMLPPGAMIGKMDEVEFAKLHEFNEQATTIAAKQWDTEVEMMRFAVEEALKYRQAAIGAALDYIKALASLPNDAVKIQSMKDDNWAKMMQAAAAFYRVRLERDELILKSKMAEQEMGFKIFANLGDQWTRERTIKVQALGQAADTYAKIAQAALSGLNSIINIGTTI